jgi:hypothetical protein
MPNARHLTHGDRAYRREKIVSAYLQRGLPPATLAKRFSLTEGHVRRVLREAGVAEQGRPWAYRRRFS